MGGLLMGRVEVTHVAQLPMDWILYQLLKNQRRGVTFDVRITQVREENNSEEMLNQFVLR